MPERDQRQGAVEDIGIAEDRLDARFLGLGADDVERDGLDRHADENDGAAGTQEAEDAVIGAPGAGRLEHDVDAPAIRRGVDHLADRSARGSLIVSMPS